ncbi:MAG TPA: DinB family protein [bacterium]|nr:DinB family protein [bacterium]
MSAATMNFAHFFDYLLTARGRLTDWIRGQPSGVYTKAFPIGLGSIRATLVHTAAAEWAYVRRLGGEGVSPADSPFTLERQPEFDPFAAAWAREAPTTRAALAAIGDPGRPVEFTTRMGPKPMRVRATAGGIAGQLLFHEVHHRAQVMAMLRQSGVAAENLDYSVLIWERTPIG